jgi:hypothetical protein
MTTGAGGLAEALAVGFPGGQGVRGAGSESDPRLASLSTAAQQPAPPGRRGRDRGTARATGFS